MLSVGRYCGRLVSTAVAGGPSACMQPAERRGGSSTPERRKKRGACEIGREGGKGREKKGARIRPALRRGWPGRPRFRPREGGDQTTWQGDGAVACGVRNVETTRSNLWEGAGLIRRGCWESWHTTVDSICPPYLGTYRGPWGSGTRDRLSRSHSVRVLASCLLCPLSLFFFSFFFSFLFFLLVQIRNGRVCR